jgi:hypothetical protein
MSPQAVLDIRDLVIHAAVTGTPVINGISLTVHPRQMVALIGASADCLVRWFDVALVSQDWKEALWARFCTGAPAQQGRPIERYSIVERA